MSEPTTVGVVVAGAAGAGVAGALAAIDPDAAMGALLGALVYFTTTRELPIWQRCLFFLVSWVMGYKAAPALVEITLWGVRPFAYSTLSAFAAALLVVTISLAAINRRRRDDSPAGPGGLQ